MKNMAVICTCLLLFLGGGLFAQEENELTEITTRLNELKPGKSRFMMRGYAHSGLEIYENSSSFVGGSFNPIFLWQQSDRLLFEGELEVELEDGQTVVGLEYANISYILSKAAILRVGRFLLPFGIFGDRLHPRWINRLPTNPLGFTHDAQVGPTTDMGVELRGGMPMGTGKINYSLYIVNGPTLNEGMVDPEEGGQLHYANYNDNNKNKAVGGRLGILPLNNSSVEIGFSGQRGKVGDTDSEYADVTATMLAVDFSMVKNLTALNSVLDVKAQWNQVSVSDASYISPEDPTGTTEYTFENKSNAWFARAALKPAYVDNAVLKNIEFTGRYSRMTLAEGAAWETDQTQITFGFNYWLDWRTVIKFAYQINDTAADADHGEGGGRTTGLTGGGAEEAAGGHGEPSGNAFFVHWSIGF